MKKLIFFYIALVFAIFLGLNIEKDPGYALFAIGVWTVEMPLWVFAVCVLLLFATLHYTLNACYQLGSLHYRIKQYLSHWRTRSSQSHTKDGLIAFSEGNWARAEKLLIKGLPSSDSPLINYLIAAKAAQEQHELHRRDKYLREAKRSMPDTKIAVYLTQAELQLASKQFEQANATLKHLNHLVPKHPHVLKLMLSLYTTVNDWHELSKLLPKLAKSKIITTEELLKLEKDIFIHQLPHINVEKDNLLLLSVWSQVSTKLQQDNQLLTLYVKELIKHDEQQQAEILLRKHIKKQWHDELIELYSMLDKVDTNKQLKFTEKFISSQTNNAALYQALGIIAKRLQLWGKSKAYLERSIELEPSEKTYYELGELYHLLNDENAASDGFRKGLQLSMAHP